MNVRDFDQTDRNTQHGLKSLANGIATPLRIFGLLISVISLHFLVVRPLVEQVDRIEVGMQDVEHSMMQLAEHEGSLTGTTTLLKSLRSQHEDLASARATVYQLDQLRKEIIKESRQIPEAMEAVSRIGQLRDHLADIAAHQHDILVPNPGYEDHISEPAKSPAFSQLTELTAVNSQADPQHGHWQSLNAIDLKRIGRAHRRRLADVPLEWQIRITPKQ